MKRIRIITRLIALLGIVSMFTACKSKESKKTTITVLQTADIHAYLNSHPELFLEEGKIVFRETGGLAYIKTLVDAIKSENPEGTLFVDGGDLIQGSGASMRSKGKIFPPIIKAMDYDLLIPGNWEVIYGKKIMQEVMNSYDTNVIAANMFEKDSENTLFPPYLVTEKKGVRIGFLAYNDPEIPVRQNPGYSEGIKFTQVEDNLKNLIHKLKNEEKVDLLFLVTHLGISKQVMLANNPKIKGVDFVLGNDTHERIRKPIKGKYSVVVEPGAFGSFLGRLDVQMENNKMIGYTYDLIEVTPKELKADAKIQTIIDEQLKPYEEEMGTVLGYTTEPIYRYLVVENPMDNFITDALLWKTGVDFATSNGFRFGVPIVPDESGKAPITKRDLWRMLPVNESIKIGEVTGKQIHDWMEKEINNVFAPDYTKRFGGWLVRFSGLELKFDSSKEYGNRIEEIKIQGKPLQLNKKYTMASYNRTGEPLETISRLRNCSNVKMKNYTLHNAVEEYLNEKGTISPKLDGRALATDLGVNAFSQMEEGGYFFR